MQKIWIYTLSKKLTDDQEFDLKHRCQNFVTGWTAHDVSLDASFELYKNRLLIFKVDETKYAASGCSIDKQLRFVKDLEQNFSIELLNRLLVAFELNPTSDTSVSSIVEVAKTSEIKDLLEKGIITKDTLIYDNTITNSNELKSTWKKPLSETYLAKHLITV